MYAFYMILGFCLNFWFLSVFVFLDGATAVLYQDNALVRNGSSIQVFTGTVHGFTVNSLEVVDEYIFVRVPATRYKDMYRSYKQGPFQEAYFATIYPFQV